jgi:hypothetical protein
VQDILLNMFKLVNISYRLEHQHTTGTVGMVMSAAIYVHAHMHPLPNMSRPIFSAFHKVYAPLHSVPARAHEYVRILPQYDPMHKHITCTGYNNIK